MSKRRRKRGKSKPQSRRIALVSGAVLFSSFVLYAILGVWFVRHPRTWYLNALQTWPACISRPLAWIGNPVGDLTDALGWTGEDVVYEYDEEAPSGSVHFAGAPVRKGAPAPDDIRIYDRGEFQIGWSDRLRHPVWCAYHVTKESRYAVSRRNFTRDREIPNAPNPDAYTRSGYDRGHLVPNYAIVTRYGPEIQRLTFMMSNIAPQSPALNQGVWRDLEHRIADLWPARYGEIWVIVGCLPSQGELMSGTRIDIPSGFYQIVVAQEGMDVRAFAVIFPQVIPFNAYPSRNLISIDELEELTGLDFLPELPSFIQDKLEAQVATRVWPIRPWDVFRLISIRLH